jgi:hypothetical protein
MTDHLLQAALATLHQSVESTGKDTARIAMELAVSTRVMALMLKTCAGAAVVEAQRYKPNSEGHTACMRLANDFLKDAKLIEETTGFMTDEEVSKGILDSAHPIPS